MPRKRYYIDASSLSDTHCARAFYYRAILGLQSLQPATPLSYGSAFHIFAANWRDTGNVGEATQQAISWYVNVPRDPTDFRTPEHLAATCLAYANKYANDSFQVYRSADTGKAAVELPFSWPWYADDDIEVLLAGTVDGIGSYNGIPCFYDIKTTAMWNVSAYLKAYGLSSQMFFYRWMLDMLAENLPDKWGHMKELSFFIDGVFLKAMTTKGVSASFMRSQLMTFTTYQMKQYDALVRRQLDRLIGAIKNNDWPREGFVNGTCEKKARTCTFFDICNAVDEDAEALYIKRDFSTREYNPLLFRA